MDKAPGDDYLGRFREIVSDPLNLLIERDVDAGLVRKGVVRLHNGHIVSVNGEAGYYGDFSNILAINRGVHEPLEEYVFQELLKVLPAAPMMVELGAYWGHYSMWLKQARPEGRVWLVEPSLSNLRVGQLNFKRNGYKGRFINALVAPGQFEIDPFMAEHGLGHLHVLHSDIQGAELAMLTGAEQTFRNRTVDYAVISTHGQALHFEVIEKLRDYGYRIEVTSDFVYESTGHDGLVFASSPEVAPVFEGFQPMGREQICQSVSEQLIEYVGRRGRVRPSVADVPVVETAEVGPLASVAVAGQKLVKLFARLCAVVLDRNGRDVPALKVKGLKDV